MFVFTWKYMPIAAGALALAVAGCAENPGGGPAADAMPAAAPEAEAAPVPSEDAEVAEPAGMEAAPEEAAVEVAEAAEDPAGSGMETAAADSGPPVTEAPMVWTVGSTWTEDWTIGDRTVRGSFTLVERREFRGREVYVLAHSAPRDIPGSTCDGEDAFLVDVATDTWIGCMRDGKVLGRHGPHNSQFSWPMYVGKKWQRPNTTWVDNVANTQGSFTIEWEVAAWEEVTVPAGTFMAYRVERIDWPQTIWYAPELLGIVKGTGGGGDSGHVATTWELVARDLK